MSAWSAVSAAAACLPAPEVHFTALPNFVVDLGEGLYGGPSLQAVALADVDGDGRLDLVTAQAETDRVEVRLGPAAGAGTLELVAGLDTEIVAPTAVIVADLASPFASDAAGAPDGKADVIVGGELDVDIFLGRGDGQFDPPEQAIDDDNNFGYVVALVAQEFDGQPGTDLAVLDDEGAVTVLCNRDRVLQPCEDSPIDLPNYDEPVDMVAGDFDGDGRQDLAVLDRGNSTLTPLFGRGDGTFEPATTLGTSGEGVESRDLAVGRLDGDGLDDLVVMNYGKFGEFVGATLRGRPSRSFRQALFVAQLGATSVALGDFNGQPDGALDAVVGSDIGGLSPSLNLNDGTGALQDPIGPLATFPIGAIAAGDLGGDARTDFVIVDSRGVTLQVVINDAALPPLGCAGDCDCSGEVSINELVLAVGIALRQPAQITCREVDRDGSGTVAINELIGAVRSALDGCPE